MTKKSAWNRHMKRMGGRGMTSKQIAAAYKGGKSNPKVKGYTYKKHGATVRVPSYTRRNAPGFIPTSWSQVTQGATFWDVAIAGIGVVAALTIPSMLKWTTGWKYLVAGFGTAAVGGIICSAITKNKTAGKVFFACALGTTLAMVIRSWMLKTKQAGLFGENDELFGEAEDLFSQDEELFSQDEEIYGMDQATDVIRPTAGFDDVQSVETFIE